MRAVESSSPLGVTAASTDEMFLQSSGTSGDVSTCRARPTNRLRAPSVKKRVFDPCSSGITQHASSLSSDVAAPTMPSSA